jgi:hypothetical protein
LSESLLGSVLIVAKPGGMVDLSFFFVKIFNTDARLDFAGLGIVFVEYCSARNESN